LVIIYILLILLYIMNRANQIRRNDTTPILSRVLYDIDLSIKTHLEQNIIPNVIHNNELLKVPIIYGTPEKWKSVQVDKFYRDDKGKAQYPLIMFKRTSEELTFIYYFLI